MTNSEHSEEPRLSPFDPSKAAEVISRLLALSKAISWVVTLMAAAIGGVSGFFLLGVLSTVLDPRSNPLVFASFGAAGGACIGWLVGMMVGKYFTLAFEYLAVLMTAMGDMVATLQRATDES